MMLKDSWGAQCDQPLINPMDAETFDRLEYYKIV